MHKNWRRRDMPHTENFWWSTIVTTRNVTYSCDLRAVRYFLSRKGNLGIAESSSIDFIVEFFVLVPQLFLIRHQTKQFGLYFFNFFIQISNLTHIIIDDPWPVLSILVRYLTRRESLLIHRLLLAMRVAGVNRLQQQKQRRIEKRKRKRPLIGQRTMDKKSRKSTMRSKRQQG